MSFLGKAWLVSVIVFAFGLPAYGQQSDRGTITGNITDPSGAVVPDVKVTARNVATSLEQSTISSQAGTYTIPFLPQGNYTVTAEVSGFRTSVQSGISVPIGTTLTVNIQLSLGQERQEVS